MYATTIDVAVVVALNLNLLLGPPVTLVSLLHLLVHSTIITKLCLAACPYLKLLPAGAPGARVARERLVLKLLYVLRVCLFVCASALITCAIYYVIRYYATAVYSSFWRFAGQATANEGSFVLPRWRKRGR